MVSRAKPDDKVINRGVIGRCSKSGDMCSTKG
jgi:hypothetical protein